MLIDFRQLFPQYGLKFNGVLHVGANVGEEAPIYQQLGIKHQVWIEAHPAIFKTLVKNISKYENAQAFNFAAGEENKDVTFHVANNNSQSSSILEFGTHSIQHPDVKFIDAITVPMKRIDYFFFDKPILAELDLLNLDIQGYELHALRGMGGLVRQFKAIYTEVNKGQVYKGNAEIESMDLFMTVNGFRRVETHWIGNWGDALYLPI